MADESFRKLMGSSGLSKNLSLETPGSVGSSSTAIAVGTEVGGGRTRGSHSGGASTTCDVAFRLVASRIYKFKQV
jgi:hypothetical protein